MSRWHRFKKLMRTQVLTLHNYPLIQVLCGLTVSGLCLLMMVDEARNFGYWWDARLLLIPSAGVFVGFFYAGSAYWGRWLWVSQQSRKKLVHRGLCPSCRYPFGSPAPERCAECGYYLAGFLGNANLRRIQQELARDDAESNL